MNNNRPSPPRGKRSIVSKKLSKGFLINHKPKSRIPSPNPNQKISSHSNRSSRSSLSLRISEIKSLEPKYKELLTKYLAASSRKNSPQDLRSSHELKPHKKHSKRSINSSSIELAKPNMQNCNFIIETKDFSQDRTLKNEHKRNSSAEVKCSRSSSVKSITNTKLYSDNQAHDINKREKLMQAILLSIKAGNLIPTNSSFYLMGKPLGKGAFGKVYLGLHRLTGLKVAIKAIDKSIIIDERTRRKVFQEVFIMKKISHPNVIRLLEVFESPKHLMLVLEYSGGGDLLQLVKSRGHLSETEAKNLFSQLIDSVKACHAKNIIHRDIKLDNILITTNFCQIKLCDFGVSRTVKSNEKIFDQCGTPAYLAPEIVADRGYEPFFVDLWSMGVLLYAVLSGTVPFRASTLPELHKLILRCKYEMPECISESAQDLIRKMLNPVPQLRISLDEMKVHHWMTEAAQTLTEPLDAQKFSEVAVTETKRPSTKELMRAMKGLGFPSDFVHKSLKQREINHVTATYYLLEVTG